MFKLIISPQVKKQLKKIPLRHKDPMRLLLKEIKEDPSIGKPLGRELMGKFSVRVSVYRIVYKINEKNKIIDVLTAGHRAIVYQKHRK